MPGTNLAPALHSCLCTRLTSVTDGHRRAMKPQMVSTASGDEFEFLCAPAGPLEAAHALLCSLDTNATELPGRDGDLQRKLHAVRAGMERRGSVQRGFPLPLFGDMMIISEMVR